MIATDAGQSGNQRVNRHRRRFLRRVLQKVTSPTTSPPGRNRDLPRTGLEEGLQICGHDTTKTRDRFDLFKGGQPQALDGSKPFE